MNEELQQVSDFFGLGKLRKVDVSEVTANRNFFVTTESGEYVLKQVLEHSVGDFEKELIYLKHLQEHHFLIPEYVSNPKGGSIFRINGKIFSAMRKVVGTHPDVSLSLAQQIGQELARLHLLPTVDLPTRTHWFQENYLHEGLKKVQQKFPTEHARFNAEMQKFTQFHFADFPQSIVHGDISPENCLVQGSRLVSILDWEEVGLAPSILDFSVAVIKFCFDQTGFRSDLFKGLFVSYQSVRPLTQVEIAKLETAIQYIGLQYAMWAQLQWGIYRPNPELLKDVELYWSLGIDSLDLGTSFY